MTLPFAISGIDVSFIRPQSMESGSTTPSKAEHLVVLVHGLWGNPKHLQYLATALREKYPEDQLYILVARQNAGSFTYDGIETGGERIAREVEDCLEELERSGQRIRKISVVGYSLGGLVARYAIGLLYHRGWFDKIEPVNFTTFATPHLGVRTPLLGFHNHIWNVLGARTLSTSGRQLFMIDTFRDTTKPLLAVLADEDSIFLTALARFRHRSLYSNIVNDRSAVFYTTSISRIDPWVRMDMFNVNYVKGYDPVIIDPDNPISPKDDDELPSFYKRFVGGGRSILDRLPHTLFLILFIPVGTVLFLINSAVQSIRSRQRIRLHEEGKAAVPKGIYRFPLMVREAQRDARQTAEEVFENVGAMQDQDYLPEGSEELAAPMSPLLSPKHMRSTSTVTVATEKATEESGNEHDGGATNGATVTPGDAPLTTTRPLQFPTLALTAAQFGMIENLDALGWRKYPVWIHNATHSHAAMIMRMPRKRFEEGKLVVKHWLSEFEI